ncbi:metal ABC transporter solute-binding protein, Zn/Mn family [Bacillus sp. MRMR6]|uniref:metal ABC transporter solute-binding protein, Zn/Mn family n=1 Tax=Bacillus sp. MRMR6 TaxID=1928617 RepID=UPI00095216AD|nr:zinc ABC transporter substrate-binding protein [Bacillus sp. MRMR6]OLS35813.1 adhesin [Bacillus sp. MRMR6]
MKKLFIFLFFILPISLVLSACSDDVNETDEQETQLTIYTTVFPLQYFTEQIGGEFVDVKTIYPPGSDEHTFEPSQKDMIKLADSDLFFYIGLGLEGFVEKAKSSLKNENVTMLPVADHLHLEESGDHAEEEHADDHANEAHDDHADEAHDDHANEAHEDEEHSHGDINPHVWLDPIYSKEIAAEIKEALIKKMPENEAFFNENYLELAQQLDDLHAEFKETISSAKHKNIIVTHAAFGYWETRYGIEQISISGLSTSNEPTQRELEKIISFADHEGLHFILFEQNVQSKLAEIVQKEIGARALPVHNLAILTEENIKNKESYFSLMNQNLETLKIALNN